MLRVLFVIALLALFPFIARAEDSQAGEQKQVIITVTIDRQSGEVRISILNVKKENKEEQQKGGFVLSDNKEPAPNKEHSRRRGK